LATSSSVDLVRQVPDEPDRVGEREHPPVLRGGAPGGRVEGGEQRVLHQHTGLRQPVEQAGLAGVGVTGDRHGRNAARDTAGALGLPYRLHGFDLAPQLRDAGVDPPPVGLQLGLTGTTCADAAAARATARAAALTRQRVTPAAQSRQKVLQLGELDLSLALLALRVLGEDVEDQRGPVDDLDLDLLLELSQLRGRQLAVADDRVGAGHDDHVAQLVDLAAADEGGGVGLFPSLDQALEDLGAGGLGESR
jgi:hypothetical protein